MSQEPVNDWNWIGQTARGLSLLMLLYWGLFALLAPVTVWDAQVYNLGRLPLAEFGGLWSNPLWTSPRQVAFPLAFDAIHLPFLHLGMGFALPSFACLIGLLAVAWSALQRWHGRNAAWLGVLTLLALPTLVFQAAATKNDLAVLFGLAVWFHAISRWRREGASRHLVFAALAIGFMAGAKWNGLPLAFLAGLFTLWLLRRHAKPLRLFLAVTAIAVVALGSAETYVMSRQIYGQPLGPAGFVHEHSNKDGIKGAAANVIRYTAANITTGVEPWLKHDPIAPWLTTQCRSLLHALGLNNVGYRSDFNDHRFQVARGEFDANADYGPIGTLGLVIAALALFWWRPGETWWRLTMAAWVLLGLVAYTVAWMPWNNRFLMASFCLLAVALVCLAWRLRWRWLQIALLCLSAGSAVAYPLISFNKRPADLIASVTHRQVQEFKERPSMLPVVAAVQKWRQDHPDGDVLLLAGSDSWALPFLRPGHALASPTSLDQLKDALAKRQANGRPAALLVLNRPDFQVLGLPVHPLQSFPDEASTALYALTRLGDDAPRMNWVNGHYSDGWTAPLATLALDHWPTDKLIVTLWNATPVSRQVHLRSSSGSSLPPVELAPGAYYSATLHVARSDAVTLSVAPPYYTGNPADPRPLGVHVTSLLP